MFSFSKIHHTQKTGAFFYRKVDFFASLPEERGFGLDNVIKGKNIAFLTINLISTGKKKIHPCRKIKKIKIITTINTDYNIQSTKYQDSESKRRTK